tara:strand:- start:308 stop:757 length:450 start_codon:yes stop_codon:yes gene_type:complete
MSFTIKTDFSFDKLAKSLPNIVKEVKKDSGKATATQSKKNIDRETHKKPLSNTTIESRERGDHPSGRKITTRSKRPLKWSNELYDSIKGTDKGITLRKYGYAHHLGDAKNQFLNTSVVIPRPERPFIEFKMGKKAENNLDKNITKHFRK